MSLIRKAVQAATQLARKSPTADPGPVIRSALKAAGLIGGPTDLGAAVDPLGCMAPSGAPAALGAFMPDWRRVRGLAPAARPAALEEADGRFEWHGIKGPWGERRYKLFVPTASSPPVALIVMLHGCTQNPDDFAAGTRMNAVAASHNVLVAYPEQIRRANVSNCWNWFDAAHQRHGSGEPALIAAITRAVMADYEVPAGQAFVAGLSAGGAMAAVLAQTDGDLYRAVGIHSGLPYLAASDVPSAFAAMRGDAAAASAVRTAARAGCPTIVFHGDADRTVHVSNADAIVAGLAAGGGRPIVEAGTSAGGRAFVRSVGRDAEGAVRFEDWRIKGAGHAWSGGSAAGSYTDPAGPDASSEMLRFFLEQIRPAPAEPVVLLMGQG